jgi:hypothetical protein
MARRGRKRQLDVGSLYWQLILSGVGTVAACKEAGIGRKTGYRWRAEKDPAGLRHLAQRLGSRFVAGYILYAGQQPSPAISVSSGRPGVRS